jgi:DNA-binding NarL/FixJ family response regulator
MRRFLDELIYQEIETEPIQSHLDKLTRRESEILRYVASGETNRQIADRLFISENTVKIHVHNILEKLNLNNRSQIAKIAHLNDLISS